MSMNYRLQEMLSKIRTIDESVRSIKIKNVKIDKNDLSVLVKFINNKSVNEEICKQIEEIILQFIPSNFTVKVETEKIKADKELVEQTLYEWLISKRKYLVGVVLREDFVYSEEEQELTLELSESEEQLFKNGKILESLKDFLDESFCEDIKIRIVGREEREIDVAESEVDFSEIEKIKVRTIKVNNVRSYISYSEGDLAVYVADAINMRSEVTVCGIITGVRQLATSKGKAMFLIDFTDKTGRLTGKFFPAKDKVKFVASLKEGTAIIVSGEMSEYNGRNDFKINNIGLCDFPEDFVPERIPAKKVPAKYKKIFPSEIEDYSQMNMFKQDFAVPECLMGKTFVVFDVETTGLDITNDRITEIGAVRIVDGKIVDCFTTLVNPQVKISAKITELTGIDDEMVRSKPTFSEICGDFYKYIDGAVMVAHNASFDMSMMRAHFDRENYVFQNDYYDTLKISRSTVKGLSNYKLNTVCDHFGIEFLHHRAMSDAHATAKLFIELINLKKCLPI